MTTMAARPKPPPDPQADRCAEIAQPSPGGAPGVPRAGSGLLRVARVDGESAAVACASTSPLRLLLARPRGRTVWAVAASHGGGLVGGDALGIELELGAETQACLTTQAETKVYRSAGASCRQTTRARVGEGALLALLPEPVSPYAGSSFRQRQQLELAPGASLVLVDSLTAGRSARGERWAFRSCEMAIEVSVGGKLLLADALRLSAAEGPPVASRMREVELLVTLVLVGPRVAAPAAALLEALGARPAAAGAVLAAASRLGDGLHLRLAAASVEAGLAEVRSLLSFLPALLGEDPLSRRP